MRRFNISVNGNSYDVAVEEVGASVTSSVVVSVVSVSFICSVVVTVALFLVLL